jgi:hypothetical protein
MIVIITVVFTAVVVTQDGGDGVEIWSPYGDDYEDEDVMLCKLQMAADIQSTQSITILDHQDGQLQPSEVPVAIYPPTQCNLPDLNPYQHHCENLQSCGYEYYSLLECDTALPSKYKNQPTVKREFLNTLALI